MEFWLLTPLLFASGYLLGRHQVHTMGVTLNKVGILLFETMLVSFYFLIEKPTEFANRAKKNIHTGKWWVAKARILASSCREAGVATAHRS